MRAQCAARSVNRAAICLRNSSALGLLDVAPVDEDEADEDDADAGPDAGAGVAASDSALPKKAALGSRWTKCRAEVIGL